MSSDQQEQLSTGRQPALDGRGLRVGIACGRFNDVITERLLDGCRSKLLDVGVDESHLTVVWAPGAFELPLVAKHLAQHGRNDAVITLGAVIRGGTPHFDFVAGECASGVARVSLDTGVPVVFGVLTTDTVEQAEERSAPGAANKGAESAATAVEMATIVRALR